MDSTKHQEEERGTLQIFMIPESLITAADGSENFKLQPETNLETTRLRGLFGIRDVTENK